jgi:hypothetical protein
VGLSLNYEFVLNRFLSIAAQAGFAAVSFGDETQGDGSYVPESAIFDLPFFVGPQLTFRGHTSDIFIRLMGSAHYSPVHNKYAFYWEDNQKVREKLDFGPYFFTGAVLEFGFQRYLNERFSTNPQYITIGVLTKLLYYRYALPQWTRYEVPFMTKLSIGYGIGL